MHLHRLFVLPFLILLLAGLLIPSDGGHGLLSVKGLAFVGTFFGLCVYFFIKNLANREQAKLFLFFICALGCLSFWSFVSLLQDNNTPTEMMIDQFKIFWLTLCVVGFGIYVVQENLISYPTFIKCVIYFNLIYSFFKLVVVTLFLIKFIDMEKTMKLLGIRFMSMSITDNLSRLQTSVDIITPFLILFVLQSKVLDVHFSRTFKGIYLFVSLIAIFFSFSRFLLFIAGCGFLFYWFTLGWRQIAKLTVCLCACLFAIVIWIGPDTISKMIDQRFFSKASFVSDATRLEQIKALSEEFYHYSLFGKGLGSYAPESIRDNINKHSYEVQWVAFLLQFGVIGNLLIFIAIGIIAIKYLKHPFTRVKFSFLLLFSLWLLSGFTNPFLISLTSGIVYLLFLLTGDQLNKIFLPINHEIS